MKPIFFINSKNIKNNPFLLLLHSTPKVYDNNSFYIINDLETALDLFPDEVSFIDNKIRNNIYWVNTEEELDNLLFEKIFHKQFKPIVIKDDIIISDCYLLEYNKIFYILKDNNFYCGNIDIINKFNLEVQITNYIDFDKIKPKLSHLGLIGDDYKFENYLYYVLKYNNPYILLQFIKYIHEAISNNTHELIYYNNILELEEYLNDYNYVDFINLDKAEKLGLEYNNLKFYYKHDGFLKKTGRIFQSTLDDNFLIQNLNQNQKQIIEALDDCLLLEIDFTAFEAYIFYQVLGVTFDFNIDPHLQTFDNIIGVENIEYETKREIGKKINFSFLYGSNIKNLFYELLETFKDAMKDITIDVFSNKINFLVPDKKVKFVENLENNFRQFGYIENYFGRKIKADKEFVLLNYYIQSTAADFFNLKLKKVIKLIGEDNRLILQKFDSMLLNIKKQDIKNDLLNSITKILLEPEKGLYGQFKIKSGKNWAEMQ